MSQRAAVPDDAPAQRGGGGVADRWAPPDSRRWLQLGLALIWVLDGVLQYQSAMFTRAFGHMLAGSGSGNPAVIAGSVSWAARIVGQHPTTTSAAFAAIQLALGLGIAWRSTVRIALAASIVWSVAVWWLGEGLGGVLTGAASPVSGAPGAVILYALLAVLLWPAGDRATAFVAARPLGAGAARVLWLVLWGSLAYFALLAANRGSQGLRDLISAMAPGEPGWLASLNRGAAGLLAHHGLPASVALAVLLAAIAAGIFLPGPSPRVAVAVAIVVSVVIWVVGQDLGAILAGRATDVNSGPLIVLVALAFWPVSARQEEPSGGGRAELVSAGRGESVATIGPLSAGSGDGGKT